MEALVNEAFKLNEKPRVVTSQEFQVFDTSEEFVEPIRLQKDGVVKAQVKGSCKRVRKTWKKQTHKVLGGSMNIAWFNSLCLSDMDSLLSFPESLLLVTESGSTVGKYYCSVKKSILNGKPCLLVHSGSCSVSQDGLECGTTITGFVDSSMQTVQEFTHEWLKLREKSVERKFFLICEEDKKQYFCQNVVKENGHPRKDKSFTFSLSEMRNVITESANVILQRIIIQQEKSGEIDLKSISHKGIIVRSNFRTLGNQLENIRGQEMRVWGVRRTIFDGKEVEEWDSIYNKDGRLVLKCQPDKDHALIPLWFKPVEEYSTTTGEFIGTRPPVLWACDMELYSQFLERKCHLASHHKEFLLRSPQLRALLADFVQALLTKKPTKVIEFGMTFFEPFLHKHAQVRLRPGSDSESDESIEEEEEEMEEYPGEIDFANYKYPTSPSPPQRPLAPQENGEFGPEDYYNDDDQVGNFERMSIGEE